MAKTLSCGDLMPGCAAKFKGASEEEVLMQAGKHAAEKHGIKNPPPDLIAKVRAAIKDA